MARARGGEDISPKKSGKVGQSIAQSEHKSEEQELIDFTKIKVAKDFTGEYVLTVWGKNDPDIEPSLDPKQYPANPDYYEIEVLGKRLNSPPPKKVERFPLKLNLKNYMGEKGIEVIGATKSVKWDLPEG
ncbi:hypothetical protein [Microbulbifer variabilis]|uniref:hypothetical protein n=1 Tax=Microbulbifer variabilis TaxID=266805 RepID=UPI00035FBC05|nr:hypothetical protein [Microbulbifer variabilis]